MVQEESLNASGIQDMVDVALKEGKEALESEVDYLETISSSMLDDYVDKREEEELSPQ